MVFVIMDWLGGPLTDLWGIPIHWIARTAKIVQFLSGSVILIEIIGKERIEAFASRTRAQLESIVAARPLQTVATGLRETIHYFVLWMREEDPVKEEEYRKKSNEAPYDKHATVAVVALVVVGVWVLAHWGVLSPGWHLLWKAPLFVLLLSVASIWFVYLVLLNIALFVVRVVFGALESVVDSLVGLVVGILQQRSLAQLLLVSALVLLIAGCALELAAS